MCGIVEHFVFVKIYVSFAERYVYLNIGFHDCLVSNDLHSLKSDEPSNNCMEWCNGNNNCRAFAVYHNTCYFKGNACMDDIKNADTTSKVVSLVKDYELDSNSYLASYQI